jgi:hypothetical protein
MQRRQVAAPADTQAWHGGSGGLKRHFQLLPIWTALQFSVI